MSQTGTSSLKQSHVEMIVRDLVEELNCLDLQEPQKELKTSLWLKDFKNINDYYWVASSRTYR